MKAKMQFADEGSFGIYSWKLMKLPENDKYTVKLPKYQDKFARIWQSLKLEKTVVETNLKKHFAETVINLAASLAIMEPCLDDHTTFQWLIWLVFDKDGSYIEDKKTGECMYLTEHNGMYVLKVWIEQFLHTWPDHV